MQYSYFKKNQHEDYRILSQVLSLCLEGIYSYLYYQKFKKVSIGQIANVDKLQWFNLTKNAYYDNAIKCWCMIFGGYNEPTHYSNLLKNESIKLNIIKIINEDEVSRNVLKLKLLEYASIDVGEYYKFHKEVLKYRNKYLIHREHSPDKVQNGAIYHPRLNLIMKLIDVMYIFVVKIIKNYNSNCGYELEYPALPSMAALGREKRKILKNINGILKL